MDKTDFSKLTVSRIDMVVEVKGKEDRGFSLVNGAQIKQFGPRRFHGLVLLTSGVSRYVVEGKYVLEPEAGALLYLPEGREYYVQPLIPGDCLCVNFHVSEDLRAEPFMFRPRNLAIWQKTFETLLRRWSYPKPGYGARCRALLYEMLAMIEEERHARYLPEQKVQAIQGAIARMEESTGGDEIRISALAAECGMSETYFRRLFHGLYGVSPKQYWLSARMRRAKALLLSTNATIAEIAQTCGFDNVYYFSHAFSNHEGMSPSEYRKNS